MLLTGGDGGMPRSGEVLIMSLINRCAGATVDQWAVPVSALLCGAVWEEVSLTAAAVLHQPAAPGAPTRRPGAAGRRVYCGTMMYVGLICW